MWVFDGGHPRWLNSEHHNQVCLHCVLHSYGLSNLAYQNLQDQNEHQCVCVLGESNAGKTETARMVSHFASQVGKTARPIRVRKTSDCANLLRCKSLIDCPKLVVNGTGICPKVTHNAWHSANRIIISIFIAEESSWQIRGIRLDTAIQKPREYTECGGGGGGGRNNEQR